MIPSIDEVDVSGRNLRETELTRPQWEIYNSEARFVAVSAGRRFGKTFLGGVKCSSEAIADPVAPPWATKVAPGTPVKPGWIVWIYPTQAMGKQIAWAELKQRLMPWAARISEVDLNVELTNGNIVAIRGSDKPDRLRGLGPIGVVMDEFADMKVPTWTEVVRPALADREGWAWFIGTPKPNHLRDLYRMAELEDDWQTFSYTTLEGGNVSAEEVEAAKSLLDPRTFRQEFEASFEDLAGRVYYNFQVKENVVELEDNLATLEVGIDFNVNPMTGVIGVKAGNQLHILDEMVLLNAHTLLLAQEVWKRYRHTAVGMKMVPGETAKAIEAGGVQLLRQMNAYPDPSGSSRHTNSRHTDFEILRNAQGEFGDHAFKVIAPSKAPSVSDRVNNVNSLLCAADGTRRLYIHPRCKVLIRALESLLYDQNDQPDKKQEAEVPGIGRIGLDHITDALGYLVGSLFPIVSLAPRVKKIRI